MKKILLVLVILVLITSFVSADDWPMFGKNVENTGASLTSFVPEYNEYSSTELTVQIILGVNEMVRSFVVKNGVIYITTLESAVSQGRLHAINLSTNSELWVAEFDCFFCESVPTVVNVSYKSITGMICHGGKYGFFCRDISNGNVVWWYEETRPDTQVFDLQHFEL